MEVETPTMEPGCSQFVSPRDSIEPIGDGQSRRKSSAMDVQHDILVRLRLAQGRQVSEGKPALLIGSHFYKYGLLTVVAYDRGCPRGALALLLAACQISAERQGMIARL